MTTRVKRRHLYNAFRTLFEHKKFLGNDIGENKISALGNVFRTIFDVAKAADERDIVVRTPYYRIPVYHARVIGIQARVFENSM